MTTQERALEVHFRLLAEKAEDALERAASMRAQAADHARSLRVPAPRPSTA